MAKLILQNQTEPASPDAGCTTLFVDSCDSKLKMKLHNGEVCNILVGNDLKALVYGNGSDGCCHITCDMACNLDPTHTVFLCAKEYNFTDFIVDSGVTVRFCGTGPAVIKTLNCFCNQGTINTRGSVGCGTAGVFLLGEIYNINNLANIGTLYTCTGGCGAGRDNGGTGCGGKGGGYGENGLGGVVQCSCYGIGNGGLACCCNGGGGGGVYMKYGYDGCSANGGNATEYNGGDGGTAYAGGGGGGRGICCGGNGGAPTGSGGGGHGGNGYYGKGGCGGIAAYSNRDGNGGDSFLGDGGDGGSGGLCSSCYFGGHGGNSYYGNGGNGGSGAGCHGAGGNGGCSYAGNGGNGGTAYGACASSGLGGSSLGGAYGLMIVANKVYNNCIYAKGGNGGSGRECGCGTGGGNVTIIYNSGTLGSVNISKGTGANSGSISNGVFVSTKSPI